MDQHAQLAAQAQAQAAAQAAHTQVEIIVEPSMSEMPKQPELLSEYELLEKGNIYRKQLLQYIYFCNDNFISAQKWQLLQLKRFANLKRKLELLDIDCPCGYNLMFCPICQEY